MLPVTINWASQKKGKRRAASARSFTHGWIHHFMQPCEHFLTSSSVIYWEATRRDVPTADVYTGPGCSGVRELGGDRGHRAPRQVPLVPTCRCPWLRRRSAEPTRVCDASEGAGRFPRRKLWCSLPNPPEPPVYARVARQASRSVAWRALPRGGEAPRATAGPGGEVPDPQEVSPTTHHLGRRAEDTLL